MIIKNKIIAATIDHAVSIIKARIMANEICVPRESRSKMNDAIERTASANIGEKSIAPNLSHRIPENKFKNGSQMLDKNLPNGEYESPGIQVRKMRMMQSRL